MRLITTLFLVSLTAIAPSAYADDDRDDDDLTLEQLPKVVRDTVVREIKGGTIREIDREHDRGKIYYEVEYTLKGKRFELHVAEDGKVLLRKDD